MNSNSRQHLFMVCGIGILALSVVFSCTKDKGLPETANNEPIDSSRLDSVGYAKDIQPMMVKYCLQFGQQTCHVSPSSEFANGIFDNYQGLKDKVDNGSIMARVLTPGAPNPMPPANTQGPQSLTATDLAVLRKWVDNGAPNN